MEDLTDFVKAAKQREDDIKDGKIYPYEKRKLLKEESLSTSFISGVTKMIGLYVMANIVFIRY